MFLARYALLSRSAGPISLRRGALVDRRIHRKSQQSQRAAKVIVRVC